MIVERLERWTGVGYDALLADEVLYEAVLHRLETLAEAASHLSDPLRERHPEIPWPTMTAFRNRLAHGYLSVNPERIWEVITGDLPQLKVMTEDEIKRANDA